jgi:hypothetical protein
LRNSIVTAGLCSIFLASAAHAEVTILKEKTKGDQAIARFATDTPIDCGDGFIGNIHKFIFVMGVHSVIRGDFNEEKLNQIEVNAIFTNSCTATQLFGREVLTDPDFQITQTKKAHVAGAVFLSDILTTGENMGLVVFDIDFTGVGTVSRNEDHTNTNEGGIHVITHSKGSVRDATVSGSLTLDDGINPVEEFIDDFDSAQLSKSKSGFLQITKD